MRSRNLTIILGLVMLLVAALTVVMQPTLRAKAEGAPELRKFEADCTNTTDNTWRCKGDVIGHATLMDVSATAGERSSNGTTGQLCAFEGSTELLTTKDGSTITMKTTGTTCAGAGINIREGGYEITDGTGRFAGAQGTGFFVLSFPSKLIHIDGNILETEASDDDPR